MDSTKRGANLNTHHLLIVDDDLLTLHIVADRLSEDGYSIHQATNAYEAFDILEAHPIQVVLSDHQMPMLTGIELLIQIKTSYPDIIRLITSSDPDQRIFYEAMEQKIAHNFIPKGDIDILSLCVSSAFQLYELETEVRDA